MFDRRNTGRWLACLLTTGVLAGAAEAVEIKILSWNIYTYNQPGSNEYDALVRIVQALDPDILLFQEANHEFGRNVFLAMFAGRYPYSFLGSPSYENPKNQILSAYPITASGEIFCEKGDSSGTFERPTVWADLDLDDPADGVADLRVYSTHYKSGSGSYDNQTRINQALEDDSDVFARLTSNPDAQIYYAGDLNGQLGDTPLTIIQAHLTRLPVVDPNNGSPVTRPASERVIDYILYSSALSGKIRDESVFNTTTFVPPATPPAPAKPDDSEDAGDHLSLISTVDVTTSEAGSSPVITVAESLKEHGDSGWFGINVLDRTDGADVESRKYGTTKLVVGFDREIQGVGGLETTDVSLAPAGSVDSVNIDPSHVLTIEMSGTPDAVPLTVTFLGIANASDASAVCTDSVCIRQLVGDARTDGESNEGLVNLFDLIAIRDHMDETTTSDMARFDVRPDGVINLFDMIDVRNNMNTSFVGSCP